MNRLKSCVLAVVALISILSPARAAGREELAGTWEYKHPIGFVLSMTLKADGSGTMDGEPIKWSASGNTLSVVEDGDTERYTIKLDGDKLHASGGDLDEPIMFLRKGGSGAAARAGGADAGDAAKKGGGLGGMMQGAKAGEPAPPGSGTWVFKTDAGAAFTLELKPDGGGAFNGVPLKWTLEADSLKLNMNGNAVTYDAKLATDELTLAGGDLPQAITFKRTEGAANGDEKRAAAAEATVVGKWNSEDGPVELKADGTGTLNGAPFRYALEPGVIVVTTDEGVTRIPYKLEGDRMTVIVEGEQGVLTRVGAGAARGGGAVAGAGAPPGAGVYVAYESSVDPNFMMSYTQYVVLWPDGTVGYAKAEGGATRAQVTDTLERFTSFKTNPQVKGQTVGTWESDGTNVVVRWNLWNNLVCRGQFAGNALHLEKMGVLEEGATLKFEKQ